MKELDLRKVHRLMGIVIAPLIILQALSGVLLSVDWLLGIHLAQVMRSKRTFPAYWCFGI